MLIVFFKNILLDFFENSMLLENLEEKIFEIAFNATSYIVS